MMNSSIYSEECYDRHNILKSESDNTYDESPRMSSRIVFNLQGNHVGVSLGVCLVRELAREFGLPRSLDSQSSGN